MTEEKLSALIQQFDALFASGELYGKSVTDILTLATRFKKIEAEYKKSKPNIITKNIAVLGSFSTQLFVSVLRLFLYGEGIAPQIREGEYNSIYTECMDDSSQLYSEKPDFLFLLPYYTDITGYPPLLSSSAETDEWTKDQAGYYYALWEKLAEKLPGTKIFQSNFVIPPERNLGNWEGNCCFSRSVFLRDLNRELIRLKPRAVTLIDADHLASCYGKYNWFSPMEYYLSKQGCTLDALPLLAKAFSKQTASAVGKTRKCLVLDLDNTLWGGIIGDDGMDGILLDPNDPLGEAFQTFQRYVKRLKERGVILAVCSKNDDAVAREPFLSHEGMSLRLEDIAVFVANWEDKAGNIRQIAEQLNIGLDSLVFFDDNPAEREIVKKYLPEVFVVDVPEDPADYVRALDQAACFELAELTAEDLSRSQSYTANAKRAEISRKFVDYDQYLRELEMTGEYGRVTAKEVGRFAQLINKSNQFNLRTRRYSDAEISEFAESESSFPIYIKLKDKFSDYGVISCLILHKRGEAAFIDTWVMSCRVLKRGVEQMAFEAVIEAAKELGCTVLESEYLPTAKNGMVADFLPKLGFSAGKSDESGTYYRLSLGNAKPEKHYIQISIDG